MTFHSRRSFLQATMAGAASALVPAALGAGQFTGKIKKAVKYHMIEGSASPEDKLKLLKDLGYDGVEARTAFHGQGDVDARVLARASEQVGLPVHGVVNSSNPNLRGAIDEAKIYGASSVLTTLPRMPKGSYREHYRRAQQTLKDAAPYAEQQNVSILIENVWASFLIEPLTMARFVDEIGSPFVQVYFDIGNVVRWGWPQNWIEVLGKRIVKLDVKEFDLDIAMNEGLRKGFDVPIGSGSIDWAAVRAELAKLDYRGWATAEVAGGDAHRLAEIAAQMDRVLDL
jgi:hexulose-6-phosphate isomerase